MDALKKSKRWVTDNKNDLVIAISFFLVAIIAFGLGRFSVLKENQRKEPIKIERQAYQNVDIPKAPANNTYEVEPRKEDKKDLMGAMLYVGSKNSNKYHLPDCPGALRIKEENKIWFSSKEEAENLGYNPATNCDGL